MLLAMVMFSTSGLSHVVLHQHRPKAAMQQSHSSSFSVARSAAVQVQDAAGFTRPLMRSKCAVVMLSTARVADLSLKRQFPRGLAQQIVAAGEMLPVRFWILDNSNGMMVNDGQRFSVDSNGATGVVRASRWQELSAEAASIAELSHDVGVRTEFFQLNGLNMPLVVSGNRESEAREVAAAVPEILLQGNEVPLAAATRRIAAAILPRIPGLRVRKQRACVVITTHGLPTDEGFEKALLDLLRLPVWCIVRVCTDDPAVIKYYNELDKNLDFNLEVLDDVRAEAREISRINPWITYSQQLHLAREFGMHNRIFDLLEEKPMTPTQVKEFIEAILGCKKMPEPELNLKAFLQALDSELVISEAPDVYDLINKKMAPWFNRVRIEAYVNSQSSNPIKAAAGRARLSMPN
jgi:hypothetical protein